MMHTAHSAMAPHSMAMLRKPPPLLSSGATITCGRAMREEVGEREGVPVAVRLTVPVGDRDFFGVRDADGSGDGVELALTAAPSPSPSSGLALPSSAVPVEVPVEVVVPPVEVEAVVPPVVVPAPVPVPGSVSVPVPVPAAPPVVVVVSAAVPVVVLEPVLLEPAPAPGSPPSAMSSAVGSGG